VDVLLAVTCFLLGLAAALRAVALAPDSRGLRR
jgi:hypothetical protein